jgi:hypothetical protein
VVPAADLSTLEGPDQLGDNFNLEHLRRPEVVTSLDRWRQGDLVRRVRVSWAVECGQADPLCGLAADLEADGLWTVAWVPGPADRLLGERLGVIVSQTCDIGANGPGSRHPTIQVAPVVDLENIPPRRAADVLVGKTTDMVALTGLSLPSGHWAADLRISLPVSKAVLLTQEPVRGFESESEEIAFSEKVSTKYSRPALHDHIANDLTASLNRLIRSQRGKGEVWMDRVEQVRVRVTDGTRLAPKAVELIVVTLDESLSPRERVPLRNWRNEQARPLAKAAGGCRLVPLRFVPLVELKAMDYRQSLQLALDELNQPLAG